MRYTIHAITERPPKNRHTFKDMADMVSYLVGPDWFEEFGEQLVLDVVKRVYSRLTNAGPEEVTEVIFQNSKANIQYIRYDDGDIFKGARVKWGTFVGDPNVDGGYTDGWKSRLVVLYEKVARDYPGPQVAERAFEIWRKEQEPIRQKMEEERKARSAAASIRGKQAWEERNLLARILAEPEAKKWRLRNNELRHTHRGREATRRVLTEYAEALAADDPRREEVRLALGCECEGYGCHRCQPGKYNADPGSSQHCCAREKRSIAGGCLSCGAPSF